MAGLFLYRIFQTVQSPLFSMVYTIQRGNIPIPAIPRNSFVFNSLQGGCRGSLKVVFVRKNGQNRPPDPDYGTHARMCVHIYTVGFQKNFAFF